MIGTVRGTMRSKKEVAGLPAPIASFRSNVSGVNLSALKVLVEAVQSGSGTPSPDNVRPITGWSGAVLSRVGKNLFDSSLLLGASGWSKDEEGVYSGLNSAMHTYTTNNDVWKIFKPNYQYTMTVKTKSDVEGKRLYFNFYYTDGTVDGINATSNDTTWQTLTLASNPNKSVAKLQISYNGSAKCYIDDLQIELGTATAYSPYNGNTYTIAFGDTYYGGELDVTNGVLRVTHQKTKIKDLSWTYQSNYLRFFSASIKNTVLPATSGWDIPDGLMCECYEPHTFNSTDNGHIYIDTIGNMFIKDTAYTDATAWISTRGEYLIRFPLATPFTIQLSPQQIAQLLGDNNVFADCGDVEEVKYLNRIDTVLFSKG